MGIGAAIIGAAIIGAGSSYYQAEQQKKIAEEQQNRLAQAEAERKAEAERIARLTKPEEESAKAIKFGSMDEGESVNDFLVKKDTSTNVLGTTGMSGLGIIL